MSPIHSNLNLAHRPMSGHYQPGMVLCDELDDDSLPGMEPPDADGNMSKRRRAIQNATDASSACLVTPHGRALLNHPVNKEESSVPTISSTNATPPQGLPHRPLHPPIISSADRGISAIEAAIAQTSGRQSTLEVTAQNLAVALSTAIQRLETGQGPHQHQLRQHENVLESPQHQQANAEQGMAYVTGKNQQREAQIEALTQRYSQAEQEWGTRALNHELETVHRQRKIQALPAQTNASNIVTPAVAKLPDVVPEMPRPPHNPMTSQAPDAYFYTAPWVSTLHPSSPPGLFHLPLRPPTFSEFASGPSVNPAQSMFTAPPTIDACPAFTPSTYRHWKREVRLRMEGYPSATASQILPGIISAPPPPAKITGASYMESTENNPLSRTVQALITQLDSRYAKTDSERSLGRLKEFTQFSRKPAENLQDFWSLFLRVTTRLETLAMKMSEEVIFSGTTCTQSN